MPSHSVNNLPVAARELLWDMARLEALGGGATLKLHHPDWREVSLVHDAPWEGSTCGYHTVFRDQGLCRMYYRGSDYRDGQSTHAEVTCYAESEDGLHWRKPELGLYTFNGSSRNNIVLMDDCAAHNLAPFLDANPAPAHACPYKAVGGPNPQTGLLAYGSEDGLRWRRLFDQPIMTHGAFDSLNLAFWDPNRACYVCYFRDMRPAPDGSHRRAIKVATSPDFQHWSDAAWLDFSGGAEPPELYTNAILPYPRAAGAYIGLPKRFLSGRVSPYDHSNGGGLPGLSDGGFISSRDGSHFTCWPEAFIRPGLQRERWINRNNLCAWGLLETPPEWPDSPPQLSMYCTENYYNGPAVRLRRLSLRPDGFVSVQAPMAGGTLTTRPFVLTGPAGPAPLSLRLNASTSALGDIRCELRSVRDGRPLPGFALDDCTPLFGDDLDLPVTWRGGDLPALAGGEPLVLHAELRDADLFAYRFA